MLTTFAHLGFFSQLILLIALLVVVAGLVEIASILSPYAEPKDTDNDDDTVDLQP